MNVENTALHREALSKSLAGVLTTRRRSDGLLSADEVCLCRSNGIPLAYDPMQLGWVPAWCDDDLAAFPRAVEALTFRPWTLADAPALARLLSSKALWRFLPETYPGPVDEETAAEIIRLGEAEYHHVEAALLGDTVIGQGRLLFTEPGVAEVSYWLGEDHWGQGLGSRLVWGVCDRAMRRRSDLRLLFARVHKGHVASQRVLEKCAFNRSRDEGDWVIFERSRESG